MEQPRKFSRTAEDVVDMGGPSRGPAEAGVNAGFEVAVSDRQPFTDMFFAQRVPLKRVMSEVKQNLKVRAAAAGNKWIYSWSAKNKDGSKGLIEGPTIKAANAIAQEFGNCKVDCRVFDEGQYWTFYALFVDWQTGYSLVRAYRQRKGQDTGMRDQERALDQVFQIGQSKAIRNVILNALPDLADYCKEEAKNALIGEVTKDPNKARAWIKKKLADLNIEVIRVERLYGRSAENWTNPDMAKIVTELEGIEDNMIGAEDVYPTEAKTDEGQAPQKNEAKKGMLQVVDEQGNAVGTIPSMPEVKTGEPLQFASGTFIVQGVQQAVEGEPPVVVVKKKEIVAGGTGKPAEQAPEPRREPAQHKQQTEHAEKPHAQPAKPPARKSGPKFS